MKSKYSEEAKLVMPLLDILSGPIVNVIRRKIEKWMDTSGKERKAWEYFSGSWKRIAVKYKGKPHGFYIRIRDAGPHYWMEISSSMDKLPVFRDRYDIPRIETFEKDSTTFYLFLKDHLRDFRRGLAKAVKSGQMRKWKKMKRDRVKDTRLPKGTKTVANVVSRIAEIALHFDPSQLKWQCADFGKVNVDDFGADEQTIIITRRSIPGVPERFIYVMAKERLVDFKATSNNFVIECEGIRLNTIDDLAEKLRAFEHVITTIGGHLVNFASGMPESNFREERRTYIRANIQKIPEVDNIRMNGATMQVDVTSSLLPDLNVQLFGANKPKTLLKISQIITGF